VGSPRLDWHQVPGRHLDGTDSMTAVAAVPDQQRVLIAIHGDPHATCAVPTIQATQLLDMLRTNRNGAVSPPSGDTFSWMLIVSPFADTTSSETGSDTMLLFLDVLTGQGCAALGGATIAHTNAQVDVLIKHLTDVVSRISRYPDS